MDRRADCSSETVAAYLASLHLVSALPQFLEGPPEFPWGSVSAVLAVQVLVAQCSPVPGLWSSLWLWLWLWLPELAVKQQVYALGSVVFFYVTFPSFHLAWLLLLSPPAAVSPSALLRHNSAVDFPHVL